MHQKLAPEKISPLPAQKPEPCAIDQNRLAGLEKLLMLEEEVRKCQSLKQLQFLIVNETAKLVPACQTIIMSGTGKLKIDAVSSLASLNKTSPTLRWLENSLINISVKKSTAPAELKAPGNASTGLLDGTGAPGSGWPFCNVLRAELPLKKNAMQARIFLLNTVEFTTANKAMVERLTQTYAHAWDALSKSGFSLRRLFTRKLVIAGTLAVLLILFVPVTMSVLAPAEITAYRPQIVAAPLNGVIGSIEVRPNENVKNGQLLFTYTPTDLANESTIADQNVKIAKSRYRRASQDAFNAIDGRREMAQLRSELDLAIANLRYADSRLEQSRVRAKRDGVILFSDEDDWIGKPVVTGEKIMRIANPRQTEYKIRLAVSDSIMLEDGDSVRVFLDTDPLNPVMAKITRRSYHAKTDDMNNMSYELFAQQDSDPKTAFTPNYRIGVRGTAQLFGKKVPLALFLFRKPLSAFRQYTGF